jgi:hypothetical protein
MSSAQWRTRICPREGGRHWWELLDSFPVEGWARRTESPLVWTPTERFIANPSSATTDTAAVVRVDRGGQDWVSRRVTTNGVVSVAWQQVC